MSARPKRCDVVVVGGGLAGRMAADRLARSADVLLVDASEQLSAASRQAPGIAVAGFNDSPARLAHALGDERAAELWRWSRRSVRRLLDLADELGTEPQRSGSWRLAFDEHEWTEWRASAELLSRWTSTAPPEPISGAELGQRGIGQGFAGGLFLPEDGQVDLGSLLDALGVRARQRGARIITGHSLRVDHSEGGLVRLRWDDGELLEAELVVLAAAWRSVELHPWFGDVLYPVRLQTMHSAPIEPGTVGAPALCRHRFEAWCQGADGSVHFTGSRWAEQPEMGAGVTDEVTVSKAVERRQREFLARNLPQLAGVRWIRSQPEISTWSCDGLPVLGPIPGQPRLLSLCGWNGWGLSAIGAAVEDLCAALLDEDAARSPSLLAARRMTL